MPIIRVEMIEGRPVEQKRELAEVLSKEMSRITGCSTESIYVVIDDVSKQNWAVNGQLLSDKYPD